ncbi:MAG: hypothetical protein H0Z40_01120 [Desulfotomaculum sp.]|nr:hypothetical protein [Desulfotomaculum sp.]
MLRRIPIKLCILAALVAVFFGVQVSLYNFNQDTGLTPPVKIFRFQKVDDISYEISFLSHNWQVNKKQIYKITKMLEECGSKAETGWQKVNQKCRAIADKGRKFSEEAVHKWKQVINDESLKTVKCWADEIFSELDK